MNKYHKTIYPSIKNDYPVKFAEYICKRFFTGYQKRILDVGCGIGIHGKNISEYSGNIVYGIDLRTDGCEYKDSFAELKECDIEKEPIPFNEEMFDYIFSKSVVEHIHNPDNFIKESYKVLKKNGLVIILTPDWKSQMSHFWDDYTHVYAWTQKSLMNFLKIHGFRNVHCEIFYQLPFIWKYPSLKFIPKIISICPQSWKWKDESMTNGRDRKLIRFSKEKMLLAWGWK
jgi:SAM-dependent methyltransferase